MATVVQSQSAATAGYVQTSTITPAGAVTAGNFLLLFVGTTASAADNVTGVTDTNGNTWVKITSSRNNGRTGDFWYVQSAAAGTPVITVTSTDYITRAMVLREINGIAASTPIDAFASTPIFGTTQSANITSTNATDLLVGGFVGDVSNNVYTPGSGYSLTTANGADYTSATMLTRSVTSAGTYAVDQTSTTSTSGNMITVAIRESGAPPTPPAQVTGVEAVRGDARVALKWTAVSGATSYNVKRAATTGGALTTIGTTTAPRILYLDTGLTNGTSYYYKISAVNGGGEGTNSAEVVGTPAAPTNVANWYPYGVQATGLTLTQTQAIYNQQANHMKTFTITQTGMPAGMAAGAWRVSNPDQGRFGLNGNDTPPGTISVSNGSTTVTGVGTEFLKYTIGSVVEVTNQPLYTNIPYIASIQSNTQLTLTVPYSGATATNATHKVGGGTFSEGIGYGIIHCAYRSKGNSGNNPIFDADAKAQADGMILYYKHFKNARGLMHWRINPDGTVAGTDGQNGATDGDLDAAFGMLKMHEHHGSTGAINYLQEAQTLINAISLYEFYPENYANADLRNVMSNGDNWNNGVTVDNPDRYMMDYFRPGYMKSFGTATANVARWNAIIAKQYEKLQILYDTYNTGLVPDESTRAMTDLGYAFKYGYNSIRMPSSIALDYLWNGVNNHPLAYFNSKRFSEFFRDKYGGVPANTWTEHSMDGTALDAYASVAFTSGHAATGLVSSDTAAWAKSNLDYANANPVTNAYFGGWVAMNNLLPSTGLMQPYDATQVPTATAAKRLMMLGVGT